MATKVKNNMGAIRSLNTLNKNSRAAQKNLRKVSTGERITSAEDDASAYGISERMREKIRSLDQANQNAQNDMAMMRTAEGAVANIVDTLRTLKQKAIDSANDSNTDEDRRIMQKEVDQFIDQIDDNALVTFNGKFLVNGNMSGARLFQRSIFMVPNISSFYSDTSITQVKTSDGELLGVSEDDKYEWSIVLGGKTYITKGSVSDNLYGQLVFGGGVTPDYTNGTPPSVTDDDGNLLSVGSGYMFSGWCYNNLDPRENRAPFPGLVQFLGGAYSNATRVEIGSYAAVNDKYGKPLYTWGRLGGVWVSSISNHIDEQISAINIIIKDSNGNIKQDVTNKLKFVMIQRAEDGASAKDAENGNIPPSNAPTFHIGADANQSITVNLSDMGSVSLGLKSGDGTKISVKTRDDALVAITAFDNAINSALDQITSIGAIEARLEYTIGNITTSTENVQASDSTNRDADMAKEMTAYTRDNILMQAAQAMLAQANQDASSILGLLS